MADWGNVDTSTALETLDKQPEEPSEDKVTGIKKKMVVTKRSQIFQRK